MEIGDYHECYVSWQWEFPALNFPSEQLQIVKLNH